jgi:glycosyltransferase 2 family protein
MKAACILYSAPPLERFLEGERPRVNWKTKLLRWMLPALLLAAIVWLLGRQIDLHRFVVTLQTARWPLVALAACVAGTLCMGGLVLRLHRLLQELPHDEPIGVWEMASIYFASSAAHNVLPAPAGEVLRTVQLKRRHGYSVGVLVAAQLIEKVIEALGLAIGALTMASLGQLPHALDRWMFVIAALGVGGATVALGIGWSYRPAAATAPLGDATGLPLVAATRVRVAGFFRRLGEGLHQLRAPSVWLRALGWSMLSDAANALTVGLCLMAVGVTLPFAAWFLAMLAARGAGLVPSTPGQFGVQEAGVVGALSLVGVDRDRALAIALLHHMAHFVPVTLIGLIELRRWWAPTKEASS